MDIKTARQLLIENGFDPDYLKVEEHPFELLRKYKRFKDIPVLKAILILMPEWLHLVHPTDGNLVHLVIGSAPIEFLDFLVKNNVPTNLRNQANRTPLQLALSYKSYKNAEYLLRQHEGKILEDYYEQQTFRSANHHIRQLLLEWGYIMTDLDSSAVFSQVLDRLIAVQSLERSYHFDDYLEIDDIERMHPIGLEEFEFYLKNGANPNVNTLITKVPLIYNSVKLQFKKLVTLLLQYQVDTEVTSPINNWTSWMYAKQTGDETMVELLEKYGAKPKALSDQNFIKAARENDIETLKQYLAKNIDINLRDLHGYTALYHAVNFRNYRCTYLLLDEGADMHIVYDDNMYRTVLELLMSKSNRTAKEVLMYQLLDRNPSEASCNRAFSVAFNKQDYRLATIILKKSPFAINNPSLLTNACMDKKDDITPLNYLLEQGANPNSVPQNIRTTPLITAIQKSNLNIVKRLLKAGADPNLADKTGLFPIHSTPIVYHHRYKQIPIILSLMRHGANIWQRNRDNLTLLEVEFKNKALVDAVKFQATWGKADSPVEVLDSLTLDDFNLWIEVAPKPMIQEVLKSGFKINDIQPGQMPPLIKAAKSNRQDTYLWLLHSKADPTLPYVSLNPSSLERCSALGAATVWNNTWVLKQTIEAGADVNQIVIHPKRYNTMPLLTATKFGAIKSIKYLLEMGANPNLLKAGYSPLFEAVRQRRKNIVQLLLEYDADPNFRGGHDIKTPLELAEERKYFQITEILKRKNDDTQRLDNEL